MAHHYATIRWTRDPHDATPFSKGRYRRAHTWTFDGGITVDASSSPHVIPVPMSLEAAIDPEEAFVAALSSCHMLSFLYIAAKAQFVVDAYEDDAVGTLAKLEARGSEPGQDKQQARYAITEVVLRPRIRFVGNAPSPKELEALHARAHHECFIANSVTTNIRVESEG